MSKNLKNNTNNLNCIFIQGVAGVGKSSVSEILADKTGWVVLDRDDMGTEHIKDFEKAREESYKLLIDRLAQSLSLGQKVIVDAPFLKEIEEGTFDDWVDTVMVKLDDKVALCYEVVWLSSSKEIRKERRINRDATRDRRISDWDTELTKENERFFPLEGSFEVSTDSLTPEQIAEKIKEWQTF